MAHGGLAYRGPYCHFCDEPGTRQWLRLTNDHPASADKPPGQYGLCAHHLALLQAAGERGRVHKDTGIRWWLVK